MPDGNVTHFVLGDWKFCCWICGRTDIKASQAVKYWQGFWTCRECWEPRNAQELIRPVPDIQVPPWVQRCGGCCSGCDDSTPTRVLDAPNMDEINLN